MVLPLQALVMDVIDYQRVEVVFFGVWANNPLGFAPGWPGVYSFVALQVFSLLLCQYTPSSKYSPTLVETVRIKLYHYVG